MNTFIDSKEAASDGEGPDRTQARQVLSDAATLSGWCLNYWKDEQLKAAGERIVYAIDVDVLKMYSDPQANRSFGRVFSQADEVSDLIAGLTADYVLHRLQEQPSNEAAERYAPLLLIPPHGAELRGVVEGISNKAIHKVAEDMGRLKDLTQAFHEHLASASDDKAEVDAFLSFLSKNASYIYNLLLGKTGAAAEMARLNMLPIGCLASPSAHPAFTGADALPIPPKRFASNAETHAMLNRCNEWYELMLDRSVPLTPYKLSRLSDDAWVLASLEWINAEAVRRGLKVRVVLISATERLHKAGSKMLHPSHDGFHDFTQAYLRDPRSFLGARDFFSTPAGVAKNETEFRILEWMSVLFPTSILQERAEHDRPNRLSSTVTVTADLDEIHEIAKGAKVNSALGILLSPEYQKTQRKSTPFPNGALKDWCDVVRNTHAQVVLKRQESARSRVLEDLLQRLQKAPLEHLMDGLTKQIQKSFTGLYLAMGVIGVDQLLEKGIKMRGVPALRFDLPEYKDAQQQFDDLVDQLFKQKRESQTYDLAKMYEVLAKSDESNYHAHVMHAFVYASSGRWFQARTLCRIALLAVELIPDALTKRRTGREAAYLMAVAERRLAVDAKGLKFAEDALSKAKQRAVGDEKKDPRFDSEKLAQEVTRIQIEYYNKNKLNIHPDPATLLSRARQLCEVALKVKDIQPRALRRWVVRQSSTNGLIVAILAGTFFKNTQIVGDARELIRIMEVEELAPRFDGLSQKYADEISDFVWTVAVKLFDKEQNRVSNARSALEKWKQPQSYPALLSYEAKRFNHFLNLAGCELTKDV